MKIRLPLIICSLFLYACKDKLSAPQISLTPAAVGTVAMPARAKETKPEVPVSPATAAEILRKKEIPILCYHQLRDWRPTDSKVARNYIVPVEVFRQQMKSLADSGYTTILPDQLFEYLTLGTPMPARPVMITFDDTDGSQYDLGLKELNKYGFKGVFFIMTVSINRPGYMTKEQIKQLSDEGHVIGSHTWDHHTVKKYVGEDWVKQIEKPSKQLEAITGKKIEYFAYPFGLWNQPAIPELKKRDMKAAFQLATTRDENDPLHTIRRIIIPGAWSPATMQGAMKRSFR